MLPALINPLHPVGCTYGRKARSVIRRRTMDISLVGHTYKNVVLSRKQYGDGSLAVTLNDKHGERVTTVSAWLPVPPSEGCIWVKNYSENSGVLEALVDAGVLETTGNTQASGFVILQEARVLA